MARCLKVSKAGFHDVNGFYTETAHNVFEMHRSDNNRVYQIAIDSATPFSGADVWSIKRVDAFQQVCIYINTNVVIVDQNAECGPHWQSVVGDKPYPIIESVSFATRQQDAFHKFVSAQAEKRKAWKAKSRVMYWSRARQTFMPGRIVQISEGFAEIVGVEQEEKSSESESEKEKEREREREKVCIALQSELVQPFELPDKTRKLSRNERVAVWSRNNLKFVQGVIKDTEQDFVLVECGAESRWCQKHSFLIHGI